MYFAKIEMYQYLWFDAVLGCAHDVEALLHGSIVDDAHIAQFAEIGGELHHHSI